MARYFASAKTQNAKNIVFLGIFSLGLQPHHILNISVNFVTYWDFFPTHLISSFEPPGILQAARLHVSQISLAQNDPPPFPSFLPFATKSQPHGGWLPRDFPCLHPPQLNSTSETVTGRAKPSLVQTPTSA